MRSEMRRDRWARPRFGPAIFVGLGIFLVLALAACESVPVRAVRGARYYAEGSEALEQGDSLRAVQDLERAAEFVPQASEIQNHLGLAYWAVGQESHARLAFDRAIELDCDNQAARQNLAALDGMTGLSEPLGALGAGEGVQDGG